MRHISKHTEPSSFTVWKSKNPTATYKDDLGRERKIKQELKDSLTKEQHYLCCYCECRITDPTSHIEHFKPKGDPAYSHLQLEYSNLFVSCGRDRRGTSEEHCGHKKYDTYTPELLSPLEPDCSVHFKYNLFGEIEYTTERGKSTIKILNLNSALLKAKRKNLIDYFLNDINDTELESELNSHLDATKIKFGEFYTMIEYFVKNKIL